MSHPNEGNDRLDYRETADITEVHASVVREHAEPQAGTMPIPTWLGVVCAVSLCWAGVYVGMFHGGFSGKVYNEYTSTPADFFPLKSGGQGGAVAEELPLLALGEKIYGQACASCHQGNGAGNAANGIPPLDGSEWVAGAEFSEKRLLAILLKGVTGPITVKGQGYNNPNMQGLGANMKPRQLAGLLTFINQSWSNKGTADFTEAKVLAAKKAFADQLTQFTADQIKAIPLTDALEGGAPATPPVAVTKPAADSAPAPGGAADAKPVAGDFDLAGSVKRGKPHYDVTCMACHQATGLGVPGAFPPIVGTEWIKGDPRRLVAIMLKGIMGAMTVDGKVYATGMPSPSTTFPQLKDDKNLADVLNYVRNSFGNKSDTPITPEFVGKVRAEFAADVTPFSEETLKNFK